MSRLKSVSPQQLEEAISKAIFDLVAEGTDLRATVAVYSLKHGSPEHEGMHAVLRGQKGHERMDLNLTVWLSPPPPEPSEDDIPF